MVDLWKIREIANSITNVIAIIKNLEDQIAYLSLRIHNKENITITDIMMIGK